MGGGITTTILTSTGGGNNVVTFFIEKGNNIDRVCQPPSDDSKLLKPKLNLPNLTQPKFPTLTLPGA